MAQCSKHFYEFGSYRIDPDRSQLLRGDQPVPLTSKAFETLLILVEHSQQEISKDELMKRLWPDTFVEEANLAKHISMVRKALGETAQDRHYIVTIPGRGYRFAEQVLVVRQEGTEPVLESHSLSTLVIEESEPKTNWFSHLLRSRPSVLAGGAARRTPNVVAGAPAPGAHEYTSRSSRILGAFFILSASVGTLAASIAIYAWMSRSPLRDLKEIQLTANSSDNPVTGDAISPDGKYLAYSDRQGVHIKLLATGESRTLSQTSSDWYFTWFPDSTRFLGSEISLPGLWSFSVIGGAPRRFRDDGTLGSVSPDGSLVAFTKNTGRVGDREMWLANSDGSTPRKILDVGEDAAVQEPWWSPDGKRLAYYIQRQIGDGLEFMIETRDLNGGPATLIYSEKATTPTQTRLRDFNWLPTGPVLLSLAESDSDLVNTFSVRCNLWELPMDVATGRPTGAMKRLTNFRAGSDVTDLNPTADGKKIAVLRMLESVSVYLAGFDPDAKRVTSPRRLTVTDGWNNAPIWDADSRSIYFESNREGRMNIFRQQVSGEAAAPVLMGPGEASVPLVSPEGAFLLYLTPAHSMVGGSAVPVQLMRIPAAGGPPQQVLSAHLVDSPRCAKAPATVCAIAERSPDGKQLIFTSLDPLQGRGRELARLDSDPNADYGWDLSPDGAYIAFVRRVPRSDGKIFLSDGAIHILSLEGGPSRELKVKGVENFHQYVDWAADGKGLFAAHPTGAEAELLYVDLKGNGSVVWHTNGCEPLRGVPSPDGRHLAIVCGGQYNNVWLIENF